MNHQSNFEIKSILLNILILIVFTNTAYSDYDEEEALIELYGDEDIISIATGSAQPISRAPAVATVITAKDIKPGYTNLRNLYYPPINMDKAIKCYDEMFDNKYLCLWEL